MSDDEFQAKLRSVFDIADVDGSGAVSTSEMASMTASTGLTFTSQQLAAMMSEADTNGNGDMDFAEFTKVIKTRLKGASSDGVGECRRGSCASNFGLTPPATVPRSVADMRACACELSSAQVLFWIRRGAPLATWVTS